MQTWIYVAGWTLVHFVWQGAVIAAGAALGFYVLRGTAANARYLLASAALSLMLLSPVVTAFVVSSPATLEAVPAPAAASAPSVLAPGGAGIERQNAGTYTLSWGTVSPLQRLPRAFPIIVVTWLTGVTILLTRLLGGWWRVRTLQRTVRLAPPSRWQAVADRLAERLGVRRMVRVADADTIETPSVVGWWRPIIMLPVAALAGLTPRQAETILAHELAHIRRHDYLVNLLQHVAETVLFYHPAVWWVSHRMRVEREQCCDAIVVDLCADPLDYATALVRLEEARRPSAGFVLAATDGSLLERVRRLLGGRTDRHTPLAHAIVTTIMIALVVLVVGGGYHWSSRTLQARDRTSVVVAVTSGPTQPARPNPTERITPATDDAAVRATAISANVAARSAEPAQRIAVDQGDSERLLENALTLENPPVDMTLAVEVNYFQLNRAEYAVPVSVRIPGSDLALARSQGAERTTIDFVGDVKDQYGITIQSVRDRLDIRLSDDNVAQLPMRSIQYETALTMLPGQYSLRLAARDAETGRIGTFRTTFQIPNLNREEKAVPISTVVLGSQLVPFNGNAQNGVRPNPLVYDGLKLIPSVTREFSTSRDMYVFLQAYQRDATTTQPLVATVALYRDGVKAFETAPLQVAEGLEPRSKAVPVRVTVPLGGLAPGLYDCEVSVVDTLGQKVTFWRTPVVLVP